METVNSQIQLLAKNADEAGRKKLIDSLRGLADSLEDTQDIAQRLLYSNMQLSALRFACDLDLFNILTKASTPLTVQQLSKTTGAAPLLLSRMLRYLASFNIVKEVSADTYTGNETARTFAIPGYHSAVYHYHDMVGPGVRLFPDYIKERKYQDINNAAEAPVPVAFGKKVPAFMFLHEYPELFNHFNLFMGVQRLGMPTWLDVYPYQAQAKTLEPEQPFFVDVGGGFGHQSIALREKLPELPNRIIVEDLAVTLEHAVKHAQVEFLPQDFFQPQQIKGAKIYYLRNILHDWPEEQSLTILKGLKEAMGPDSVILIDEMVLPATGTHWQATQLDFTMMVALASIERTEAQWRDLIPKAGLKISNIYTYTTSLRDSIIELVAA